MIVSFTGTYEKANDDIEIVSDNAKNQNTVTGKPAESQGYIAISNDWSDSSKLIRPYAGLYNGVKSVDVASAKVVSDSTVIYIDENGYVVDEGTPSKAEELSNANGYYANAFVIVNSDNEIDLLVYETSNRIKDGKNEEVQLTNKVTASVAANETLNLKDRTDIAPGATVTLDKEGALILPNGKKVDAKALKATGNLVLTANDNGGVTVTAAKDTTITVPSGTTIKLGDKDTKNFVDGSSTLDNIVAATYKFDGTNWVKQA